MPNIWSISLLLPTKDLPKYTAALEVLNSSVSFDINEEKPDLIQAECLYVDPTSTEKKEEIEWKIHEVIHHHGLKPVPLSLSILPEKDWLAENRGQFPPLTLGNFFIYSDYYNGPIPQDQHTLRVNASVAFGSGEHETTKGCLKALEDLQQAQIPLTSALDMGCGSGILSLAMAMLWPKLPITAVDFDPFAIKCTQENIIFNKMPTITPLLSDGFDKVPFQKFSLIVANVLAQPLIQMVPDMARYTQRGSYVVLSGLLDNQTPGLILAYQKWDFSCYQRFSINNWATLVFKRL